MCTLFHDVNSIFLPGSQYNHRHLSAETEGGQMLPTRQSLHEKGNPICISKCEDCLAT